jgi:hypothetical protein
MTTLSGILIMYLIAILYGKRRERIKIGGVIILVFLAAIQAILIMAQMFTMPPPSQ